MFRTDGGLVASLAAGASDLAPLLRDLVLIRVPALRPESDRSGCAGPEGPSRPARSGCRLAGRSAGSRRAPAPRRARSRPSGPSSPTTTRAGAFSSGQRQDGAGPLKRDAPVIQGDPGPAVIRTCSAERPAPDRERARRTWTRQRDLPPVGWDCVPRDTLLTCGRSPAPPSASRMFPPGCARPRRARRFVRKDRDCRPHSRPAGGRGGGLPWAPRFGPRRHPV